MTSLIKVLVIACLVWLSASIAMNRIITDEVSKNSVLPHTAFRNVKNMTEIDGLWKCVKLVKHNVAIPEINLSPSKSPVFFFENNVVYMEYPCYCNANLDQIVIKGDSLFLSEIVDDVDKMELIGFVGFIGDSMIINRRGAHGQIWGSEYYLPYEHDEKITTELLTKKFNTKCVKGNWSLFTIDSGEDFVEKNADFNHVPQEISLIDLATSEYHIVEDMLYLKKEDVAVFKVIEFRWSEEDENKKLVLKDLKMINGKYHNYVYMSFQKE